MVKLEYFKSPIVLITGLCKRNVPCFKIPAPSAARQSDLPWTAQSANFGKFRLNSLNLAPFLLLNPVFVLRRDRWLAIVLVNLFATSLKVVFLRKTVPSLRRLFLWPVACVLHCFGIKLEKGLCFAEKDIFVSLCSLTDCGRTCMVKWALHSSASSDRTMNRIAQ